MERHKWADVMIAYAEGKECEVHYPWLLADDWRTFTHEDLHRPDWNMQTIQFRVKK